MSSYKHEKDKTSGEGLAINEWNTLSSSLAGNSGLHLALSEDDKVGVGTPDPMAKLHIKSSKSPSVSITDGGTKTIQIVNDHGKLKLCADGAIGKIFTTDKLGIGVEDPIEPLEVKGNVKATKFIGDGSELTNLRIGETGLMIATNAGSKVGIGTTAPAEKLHVLGNTVISGNTTIGGRLKIGHWEIYEESYEEAPCLTFSFSGKAQFKIGTEGRRLWTAHAYAAQKPSSNWLWDS